MGNSFTCFSQPPQGRTPRPSPLDLLPQWMSPSSLRSSRKNEPSTPNSSSKTDQIFDDSYIKQQAQIASMLYQHHLQNNSDILLQFNRSVSTKNPPSSKKQKNLSMRSRSVSSSINQQQQSSLQLFEQESTSEANGKKHFVLVHGGGFGAWCWYKIIALLKEANCGVDPIDLTGSGANFCDINSISTLEQYSKPLLDFLVNLEDGKQVILVGHDIGGACVSYAMELHPAKVSKAIFVAATMLANSQSALDVFSQQKLLSELNQRAQKFLYANGKNQPPTAMEFDKSLLEDFLFNRTPSKDIALASVSMRTLPFGPLTQKLTLTKANYGSIPRFYIKTDEDLAIPLPLQEHMIQSNPPTGTFQLKGSDHSPFFSKPQALQKILLEV
ncbi:methylesterase 11, chloroplastic [Dorcoceras hygrometricum]|uniref:Methylesterase 11, chloroplastic n=1 Tax=Dorcoceras hygrometricum TaxID=472368 RepID=A0A2Z7ASN3_9LAMI|nr:methylesterase 11, chloroplastic [Dorcoceras hygrometricum]